MNRILKYINLVLLPVISLVFLVLVNQLLIDSSHKMILSILMVLGYSAFCLAWLLTARLMKDERIQMIIGFAWLFILVMAIAYSYFSTAADEAVLFFRQYQDYLLIWIGIIGGYELSLLFSSRKKNKEQE